MWRSCVCVRYSDSNIHRFLPSGCAKIHAQFHLSEDKDGAWRWALLLLLLLTGGGGEVGGVESGAEVVTLCADSMWRERESGLGKVADEDVEPMQIAH